MSILKSNCAELLLNFSDKQVRYDSTSQINLISLFLFSAFACNVKSIETADIFVFFSFYFFTVSLDELAKVICVYISC